MTTSRTIRLFVSSTFSDLKAERNALQEKVFPRLKQLCLSKGLRFQAIDLRWGISEEAGRDNRTMRICLRELKRCQEDRPKPNFLILLGDRYGWRPLPETVPADLFERLETQVRSTDTRLADLLGRVYRRDDNAVPPVYELRPRAAPYDTDFDRWHREVELPLLDTLTAAAETTEVDLGAAGVSIGASATEQEIIQGALKVSDAPDHVRAFFRAIDGLPERPPPKDYVDLGPDGYRDTQAAGRLDALKTRIGDHIGKENVCKYRVPWTETGIALGDLTAFCEEAWQRLSAVVLRQIESLASVPPEEQEEQAHRAFGDERCRGFVGRREPLDRIAGYLREGPATPLAVVGPAGSGKSALMAEAVRSARESHPDAEVLARFIGATPGSADIIQLLRNVVGEIRRRYPAQPQERAQPSRGDAREAEPNDSDIPFEFNPLVNSFNEALRRSTTDRPLYLFLDALDQLGAGNNARSLIWLPTTLVGHVRLVVSAALPGDVGGRKDAASDPRVEVMTALESRMDDAQRVTLAPLTAEDGSRLLDQWLADAGRRLQGPQRDAVLAAFAQEGNPLWLRAAADEAGRLRSWEPPPAFAPRVPDLIGQVLGRLSLDEEHGAVLVARALGYIACARHGLAEDEVIAVLSDDAEVMADFRRRSPNSPPVSALPVAVWVRLHGDIAFYLTEHEAQGASLLGFYHRSFLEAVQVQCLASRDDRRARHQHLGAWFGRQGWFIPRAGGQSDRPAAEGTFSDPPNTRKASELPWHLYKAADESDPERCLKAVWQPLADALCDLHLLEAKVRSGLVFELEDDYHHALSALPEAQAKLEEERRRQERAARWTREIIEYSRQWSERRDRHERGEDLNNPQPRLPKTIKSVQPWSNKRIGAQCRRITEHPTRLDWMETFAGFVESQCYPLVNFGEFPGFALQHAKNYAPGGPVHEAASTLLSELQIPSLLRRWPPGAIYNPRPALLRTLEGHTWLVDSVSVTPDGRLAVSGSGDGTVRVWDLQTGACLRTLEGHSGRVRSVSVTPDGRRAVSASLDKTLRVWNLQTGACLRTLEGHSDYVLSVSVTPDGRWAISASNDKTLRVWDLQSGACLRTLEGHSYGVKSVSVTPDGRRAVSGSDDRTLRVWDLESGACLRVLEGHRWLVNCVSVTPDGRRAVSAGHDLTLRVWNLGSGQCVRALEGHSSWVNSVSVTPDGRRAVSAGQDLTLRVWDLESGECLRTLEGHSGFIESVSVTPDGRRAVSVSWDDDTLRVWNLESGACLRTLEGHRDQVVSVNVTADGRRAVSASYDDTLRVWDLASGQFLRTLEGHRDSVGGAMSVSMTPDGRRVVSASDDKTLRVWDLETGACLRTLEGHTRFVESVSVTPDGRWAVSASSDKTLRVWDLESGQCLRTLEGHSSGVTSVSVTPDGRWAVSASSDKTLRVWDLASGERVALFSAPARVVSVAVSASKASIVCGTKAGEVIFLESRGIAAGPTVLTVSRFRGRPGATGIRHAARCPYCGVEFEPAPKIVSAIESLSSRLAPGQSPCLELPDDAFADPRLLSTCPHCAKPLQFNPFLIDVPG